MPTPFSMIEVGLEDGAVYIVFREGEEHREFSTEGNRFNLPKELLEELGL